MLNYSLAAIIVFGLNFLWFGMAFRYFSLTPETAANLLVPESTRESPLFRTMVASIRFLGGFNFAFAAMAVLLIVNRELFPEPRQTSLLAAIFSIAHASQFVCNIPVALGGGRHGESMWPVLSGPMLFIFIVDLSLAIANGVLAAALYAA